MGRFCRKKRYRGNNYTRSIRTSIDKFRAKNRKQKPTTKNYYKWIAKLMILTKRSKRSKKSLVLEITKSQESRKKDIKFYKNKNKLRKNC